MPFSQPLDVANRALQIIGQPRVTLADFNSPSSRGASETNFSYDKMRLVEIQRNLWTFSTRRVILRAIGIDTVLWTPPTWVSGTAYSLGAVVAYTPTTGPYQGATTYWQLSETESSSIVSPDQDPLWHHYAGPLAIDLYNTGAQGTGSTAAVNDAQVYQSGEVALVPATYNAGTTYSQNQVVAYESGSVWSWYVSLVNSNTGNTPSSSPTDWALWTSQGRGQGSYGQTTTQSPIPLTYPTGWSVFISLYNNNSDNPAQGTTNWLNLSAAAINPLHVSWPINSGPVEDASTDNAFHLPVGFLKRAPTDPKGGQLGYLGANSGVNPEDWVIEGRFLVSADAGPLMMRFVADITDVSEMDPMFCEGLSARIGQEIAPALTNVEPGMQARAERAYKIAMGDARATNSIEVGPISPVENRYVTVRV